MTRETGSLAFETYTDAAVRKPARKKYNAKAQRRSDVTEIRERTVRVDEISTKPLSIDSPHLLLAPSRLCDFALTSFLPR
jgi:hypothetical protein